MIKTILEENPDLRQYLFIRGFLVTSNPDIPAEGFPFYGSWNHKAWCSLHFWTHPLTGFHTWERNGKLFFLLGHAYNPFTMEIAEEAILQRLSDHDGEADFYDFVDELTGIFVLGWTSGSKLTLITDCAGMQCAYYGRCNGYLYISSHMQLIGDLCGLKQSEYVQNLISYRFYRY